MTETIGSIGGDRDESQANGQADAPHANCEHGANGHAAEGA